MAQGSENTRAESKDGSEHEPPDGGPDLPGGGAVVHPGDHEERLETLKEGRVLGHQMRCQVTGENN